MTATTASPPLSDELRAVAAEWPGWHTWLTSAGRVCATHCLSRAEMAAIEDHVGAKGLYAGSGVTLDAATPEQIRRQIAQYVAQAARAA
jgi:hypothetical protein